MRKIVRTMFAAVVFIAVVCATTGCQDDLLSSSARTGAATFLTTVINGAFAAR